MQHVIIGSQMGADIESVPFSVRPSLSLARSGQGQTIGKNRVVKAQRWLGIQ